VQQHLQRLDGVDKVEVSLLEGRVVIVPKQGALLDPLTILKSTYDSGVSVVELGITGVGTLVESGGGLQFRPAAQQSLPVTPGALTEQLKPLGGSGREVSIRGRLFQLPPGSKKPKELPKELPIEILEIR
jgi:hypothetical protein